MSFFRTVAVTAALLALSAAPALAHPKLVSETPAADASVAPTNKLVLHFSETLEPKFTGATVTSSKMKMGDKLMDHVMKIDLVTAAVDPADAKTLVLTLKSPLPAGTYKVAWHAVSTDTHRLTGVYSFSVK